MRTVRTKIYKFDELSKEVQEKVIDNNYSINVDDTDWSEWIIEDSIEMLSKKGFEDAEISFSGFASQGDGASFTGSVSPVKWIEANDEAGKYNRLKKCFDLIDYNNKIERISTHYYHESTVRFDLSPYIDINNHNDFKNIYALLEDLEEDIQEHIKSLSVEIYKRLEKSYDYLTGREAVIETIEANDYEFTRDGKRF